MNRNILCFCIGIVVCTNLPLYAQQVPTATAKNEARQGRIERAYEDGRNIVRFFNRDGVKIKELREESTETKAGIAKGKPFDPLKFEISLSSTMAVGVGVAMKNNPGRDMFVLKIGAKDIRVNDNKKFTVVHESYSSSIHFASASDSEELVGPVEDEIFSTVYDSDGNEVARITEAEGYEPQVSNTGRYFVVTSPDEGGMRILNSKKEMLAELHISDPNIYFSDTDKYIIFAELTRAHDWAISVFDTQNIKPELRKLTVPNDTLQGVESLDISEKKREMTIVHYHYVTEKPKVDKIAF